MKVAVIGGGASGMTAALAASKAGNEVLLFERQARVGKKLLATGNGRCNLSNTDISPEHFHSEDKDFCKSALSLFDEDKTREFFLSLGLVLTELENGRIYPLSEQANSVVDCLRLALTGENITVLTDTEVTEVKKSEDTFVLLCGSNKYIADKVIVACGGMAAKKLGGTSLGYDILRSFGHTITKLSPSLVQLKTDNTYTRSLKGVRAEASVKLIENKKTVAKSTGEIQFTDYGVSGPAVFEISRAAALSKGAFLSIDLMREHSKEDIVSLLETKKKVYAEEKLENLLVGILHNRLGRTVLRYCGYKLDSVISDLSYEEMQDIADGIKHFELSLLGTTGFENAQVTAGGVSTCEFDKETLESKLVPGLFAAGEVLDVDGDCGGYNLQWAWSSGLLAAKLGK